MRRKIAAVALAGALGLTGGAVLAPAVAGAQSADPGSSRLSALRDVLESLVTDGTLTQAQADKVAAHLDSSMPMRGPRHHGGFGMRGGMLGHGVVAGVLGITVEELHEARHDGKSLAEIAASKGISKQTLITRLVAAAQEQLADAVADGRLTQAQADARKARLQERVTAMVDRTGKGTGPGMHRGGGMGMHPEDGTR